MTENRVPVDDPAVIRRILTHSAALLLDFDGPVCSVFAGLPAPVVADQLREILAEGGHDELPPEVQKSDDPFDVLSYAAAIGHEEGQYVEASLRAHEVEAVRTAQPTFGAHDLIRQWHSSGHRIGIVSNNSSEAVETYLHLHDLAGQVEVISAREKADPGLLKPNPHLLELALVSLELPSALCVFVGDSTTDVQASRAAGIPSIGFANKPGKDYKLAAEVPEAVITSMAALMSG